MLGAQFSDRLPERKLIGKKAGIKKYKKESVQGRSCDNGNRFL